MRLHQLIKRGIKTNLKNCGESFQWKGYMLYRQSGEEVLASDSVVLGDNWQLDEPTVEDVLKERGYKYFTSEIKGVWIGTVKDGFLLLLNSKPETVAEMNRILDFLETLNLKT